MSERKTGHEQFRNLFKGQSSVRKSTKDGKGQQSHKRRSKGGKSVKSTKSGKSVKRKSGGRDKSSKRRNPASRKKVSTNMPDNSENSSNRHKSPKRAARTPTAHAAHTPTTPPTATTPNAHTAGSIPTTPKQSKYNGQDVQEKTMMCNTVFENDVTAAGLTTTGGETGGGGGGGHAQPAAARIKERKLQWKKEDDGRSPAKTDPRQQETSASHNEGSDKDEKDKFGKIDDQIPQEANKTILDRTIFENDDDKPAVVKEEKAKLQWAPGAKPAAAHESASEPAVRKKQTTEECPRGAVSERPPRDTPPVKPPRGIPAHPPVKLIPVTDLPAVSPGGGRPRVRDATSTGQTTSRSGSIEGGKEDVAEKMVSCYIAPTLQHVEFNSAELVKKDGVVESETYPIPKK